MCVYACMYVWYHDGCTYGSAGRFNISDLGNLAEVGNVLTQALGLGDTAMVASSSTRMALLSMNLGDAFAS